MILRSVLIVLAIIGMASLAHGQATQPASVEQRPLLPSAKTPIAAIPQPNVSNNGDLLGIKQLFVGLLIVLSLIFAARWYLPRVWPAVGAQRNSAVRIIGRTPISPKNQLVLVQVGQRVLVLGENANQLSTLSTIDNADEVALLIGKANTRVDRDAEREPKFAGVLDESNRAYESEVPEPEAKPSAAGELSELIGKVRGLAKQIGRS